MIIKLIGSLISIVFGIYSSFKDWKIIDIFAVALIIMVVILVLQVTIKI